MCIHESNNMYGYSGPCKANLDWRDPDRDKTETVFNPAEEKIDINMINDLILRYSSCVDKSILKYYNDELRCVKEASMNKEDMDALIVLVQLYSRYHGFNKELQLQVLDKILKKKPISPLTFDDSEFIPESDITIGNQILFRNRRLSTVYKVEDFCEGEKFINTHALDFRINANVDISDNNADRNVYEAANKVVNHFGRYFLWDKGKKDWSIIQSDHVINTDSVYVDQTFTVSAIEVYDYNDHDNDYYALIVNKTDLLADFFKYFRLTEKQPNSQEKEIIANLKELHAENFFNVKWKKPQIIDTIFIDYDKNEITVYSGSIESKHKIQEEFMKCGLYSVIRNEEYDENGIRFVYNLTDALEAVFRKMAVDYDIKIETIGSCRK